MLQDVSDYLSALWKHWKVLVSGVGSIILSTVSAYLKSPLPYWAFWVVALVCFFVASFLTWRDQRSPRISTERLQLVREQWAKLSDWQKLLLRELQVRGQMLEDQASKFLISKGFGSLTGGLNSLEHNTNLVARDYVGHYRINPELVPALRVVMSEKRA